MATQSVQPKVYGAIAAVQADLCAVGIGKDQTNSQQKYRYRGIDDVYNVLGPLLAKHGLCILPRMLSREVVERKSSNGGALFYVTLEAEFDFVAVADGSSHTIRTFGEAMDSGDKATNKAMSAAYKYAAFQAFAIPTEGDNDADGTTHNVQHAPARQNGTQQRPPEGKITAQQKVELEMLLKDVGASEGAFLDYLKVEKLEDIKAANFDQARRALEAKRQRRAA